jgi:hypothetical protein
LLKDVSFLSFLKKKKRNDLNNRFSSFQEETKIDSTDDFEISHFIRSVTQTVVNTLDTILARQDEIIDKILTYTLTSPDPFVLNTQKSILIIIVTIAGILGTLAVAFLTVVAFEVTKACKEKIKRHRQRHRFELIPTYHNVRVLRQTTFEPNFDNYSEETLPPYPSPSAPIVETELDTFRRETVIKFKDGQE